MTDLQADHPLRPRRRRAADREEVARLAASFTRRRRARASENYSIAIPPPNVTGVLHMGHAFQDTIMDTLIRYHRMLGRRSKWILGTDHAGIATQTQVERLLAEEGTSRERARSRALRAACLGVAPGARRHDHRAAQAPGRLVRLRRGALHARRGLRAGGARSVRRAVREGLHLPRPLHGQLGPRDRLGDLRPRGRADRGQGHPLLHRLPARGRLGRDHGRDRQARDDARRHRDRGAPRTTIATGA